MVLCVLAYSLSSLALLSPFLAMSVPSICSYYDRSAAPGEGIGHQLNEEHTALHCLRRCQVVRMPLENAVGEYS
jgi:hypothetical protein